MYLLCKKHQAHFVHHIWIYRNDLANHDVNDVPIVKHNAVYIFGGEEKKSAGGKPLGLGKFKKFESLIRFVYQVSLGFVFRT